MNQVTGVTRVTRKLSGAPRRQNALQARAGVRENGLDPIP